jgi:hypothetical protein
MTTPAQLRSADDLEGCAVFTHRDNVQTVGEVMRAAHFRGRLAACWERLWAAVEAREHAEAEGAEVDLEAVQALSEEFRYQRDLITTEETEAWLAARGLTGDDFNDHFVRQYWCNLRGAGRPVQAPDLGAASREAWRSLAAHVWLSDGLEGMARDLAHRLAVWGSARTSAPDEAALGIERKRFFDRTGLRPGELGAWLAAFERDSEWFERMLTLEAVYLAECERWLRPESRRQALETCRLSLVSLEVEVMDVESPDAAREAYLVVGQDGVPMAELARQARYPYRQAALLLEEVPPEGQERLLAAPVGGLLEPWDRGEGYQLCRVLSKREPSLEDDRIRARVDARILEGRLAGLESESIRWLLGPRARE